MSEAPGPYEALPGWCIGECQIRWHHVGPDETDMVCLACTLRQPVPAQMRGAVLTEGWDAWLGEAQVTFELKASERGAR